MSQILLWILSLTSPYVPETISTLASIPQPAPISRSAEQEESYTIQPLVDIQAMLHQQAPGMSVPVMNKVLKTLKCAMKYNVARNNILTVIDYSLPSSEKRLWVFNLQDKKLLYHTYVSHGIKSGALATNYFSNKYDSKASSIGVYKTEKAYYGREGLSLRLAGLEANFNDNASNRSVVMHGGWYVEEDFIKKYGRPGRSWGCPALPLALYQPIINTIKDNSLMVVYYPSESWFVKSRFLNCDKAVLTAKNRPADPVMMAKNESRAEILLTPVAKKYQSAEGNAVVAMPADKYQQVFHSKAPLERMLRRQINKMEYIALSTNEFNGLVAQAQGKDKEHFKSVFFVVPVLTMVRGYYETKMKIINLGKIKEVRLNRSAAKGQNYTVYLDSNSAINIKATDRFIRWLGL